MHISHNVCYIHYGSIHFLKLTKPGNSGYPNLNSGTNSPAVTWRALWKWFAAPTERQAFVEALNNFTPRAQQVLALARLEADRFNHNFVGTEHLLLGLIRLGQGVAVNVLARLELNLETVRMEVEKQVGTGPEQKVVGTIPYTPRAKRVLDLAAKEAKALNHTYLGTEHILLGLLREGDGVAPRVLANLGVDTEKTRLEILKELDPNFDPATRPIEARVVMPQTSEPTKPEPQ